MRFLLLTLLTAILNLNTFAQAWIDTGLKAGIGASQLVNSNVWQDATIANKFDLGYSFGAKLGLNFNLKYQVTFDFIYSAHAQEFEFQPMGSNAAFSKNITYSSFDMPLLFRHNSDGGSFFEIGPQLSLLSNFTEKQNSEENDISSSFTGSQLGAVLGFGSFLLGNNNSYLVFGIRVHYGLRDLLTNKGGKNTNSPFPINNGERRLEDPNFEYDSYKITNQISGLIYLEFNYDLAYLVRSNCKRTAIKFF